MKYLVIPALLLLAIPASAAPGNGRGSVFDSQAELVPHGRIDEAAFRRWKELGIQPAALCTDEVFLRRAYLDTIGTIPTAKEVRQFLGDKAADKRRALVDRLLAREEFADYWAMKWGDLLRIKAEFPINLWPNAVQAYHRWIRTSLKENVPYDRFVRELLTASGSNFRAAPVNFYRACGSQEPEVLAKAVALAFMGARVAKWEKARLDGMAVFFSCVGFKKTREWKEEIVFFDSIKAVKDAEAGVLKAAVFPDGTPAQLSADRDPREVFADWLLTPQNPWFTRSITNRVWSWLLGRGIIHEPDDIRPDNPPANPELLDVLQKEFVASKYDLKHLFRLILNSTTYQLSSVPRSDRPDALAQFACYPMRRLEAEVLADAVCQITGTTEEYSSAIPEPFTFIPEDTRSIALPDGSITSSFLELFGRPPRDTGLESERTNDPTPSQRLHLLNSSHIHRKIEQSAKLRPLFADTRRDLRSTATELYLTIISRFPTDAELATVEAYSKGEETKGPNALLDLAWALVNSTEFLYRH